LDLTFPAILDNASRRWPGKGFIYTRNGPGFTGKTFGEYASDVRTLSAALINQGLTGKHFLIYGENSYEWMVAELACSGFTGISCVVSKNLKKGDLRAAIAKTDASAVFYSESLACETDGLQKDFDIPFFSLQTDLYRLIDAGKAVAEHITFSERDMDALCKIIFTSGTTSQPKAVMLSQKNIFSGVNSLYVRAPMNELDSCYLFLPLSHTYGGIYNFVSCLKYGIGLYLCSDINLLAEELGIVRPTIFCAVPQVLERFMDLAKASTEPAKALKQIFGENLRYLFCGGSLWSPEDRAFYKNAGINLLEAYALTETASSLSISYSSDKDVESVGKVFEHIEVRIDSPDENGYGEILTRGDHVFLGYYNNEKATKAAIDSDGFFHTGDIGKMDSERRLYLKGRG